MRITDTIHIDRSVDDVFTVLTDPAQLPAWQPTTVEVHRERTGSLSAGERFDEVHSGLGRKLRSTFEVAEYTPPRAFALSAVDGPFLLDGRWTLTPQDGGTRLDFVGESELSGLLRIAEPLVARSLARRFRGYHRLLRTLVEARGPSGDPAAEQKSEA